MLEKLAGRHTWEPMAGGIRVEIPAQRNWTILFFAVWLVMWTVGGRHVIAETFGRSASHPNSWFNMLWLGGWAIGECVVSGAILWGLGGSITLMLDPSNLEIRRRLFGLQIGGFTCPTSKVRNLRFTPAGRGRNAPQSAVSIEVADKSFSFASGISDAEAFALIDKMLEIYKFPRDRALDYINSST